MTKGLTPNEENEPEEDVCEKNDNNVIAIFFPILGVLVVACAGACYYSERKRRRRLKQGGNFESENINDTDSVISAASTINRPYLLPASRTGRNFRTHSRSGWLDNDSTYGEPPPYSGSSRRSSIASQKASHENALSKKGIHNQGYHLSNGSLNRSMSMLNLQSDLHTMPLRRSQSSLSLHGPQLNEESYDRKSGLMNRSIPSPVQSEWSIRTAPPMRNYDFDYIEQRPSSVASLPVRGRRSNIKRSMSQPNLEASPRRMRTYPQGILKRNRNMQDDETSSQQHAIPFNRDFYGDDELPNRERKYNQMENSALQQKKNMNYARKRYDGYFGDQPDPYAASYSEFREDPYNGSSTYSAPAETNMSYRNSERPWGPQYSRNYDPYGYSSSFYNHQKMMGAQPINPYQYGAMMY